MDHNDIINTLCKAGYPAYLVGGCIRDEFLGIEPHDFDIVTLANPQQIEDIFSGQTVNTAGKQFCVTIVNGYEVATFRTDNFDLGNGAKNCVVEYADNIHTDLERRDLSINALALCPITGDVIDDHNGLEDIKNRVIRFVGNAQDRINEDPLRVLRSARFLAKIQGSFDIDTLLTLQENAHMVITNIAPERIGEEVKKAMTLENPSLFFGALEIIGALDYVFPGMSASVNHDHGKWHQETVWEHLMLAGDAVSSKYPLVRLAAFLHDVGKPSAYAFHNDGSFINHENISADMVDRWLKRLKFSNEERETIVNLIRVHMLGGSQAPLTPKAIRKLQKTFTDMGVNVRDYMRLRIADRTANILKDNFSISDIKKRFKTYSSENNQEAVFSVNSLALKGIDIINTFGIAPSPLVGQIQRHLLDFVIENGFEFNTVEHLTKEVNVHFGI